jgi:hypothetical protein
VASDFAASSFDGAANTTQNTINATSHLVVNLFSGTANATQNASDGPSELNASSLVKLLMQVKT